MINVKNKEEWMKEISQDIVTLRRQINEKADMAKVEEIKFNEKLLASGSPQDDLLENTDVSFDDLNYSVASSILEVQDDNEAELDIIEVENACSRSLRQHDIQSALLSVFRYLEYIEKKKADVTDVSDRATRTYVEDLFKKLLDLSRQQISTATLEVQNYIEKKFFYLSDSFSDFTSNITKRSDEAESRLSEVEDEIMKFAGISIRTKQKIVGNSKPKTIKVMKQFMHQSPSAIAASRERAHAIVNPQKPKKKREIKLSDLMPALTISSPSIL